MRIRPAIPADAAALSEIQVTTWRDAYKTIFPEAFLAGLAVPVARWETRIATGVSVLASLEGDRVIGYCSFSPGEEEGWAELRAIYVHPDYQGLGHGGALLSAAEAAMSARRFSSAVLWVLEGNLTAQGFYDHRGWRRAKPVRIETIGGIQVTLVRYEISLRGSA